MALIVYTDTADVDPTAGIELLEAAGHDVVRLETRSADEICAAGAEADALFLGYAKVTADMLDRMPNVSLISAMSAGTDHIDVETATERGICVANVGGAAADDVATHALTLALALIRGLPEFLSAAAGDSWFVTPYAVVPPRVTELTLGLAGMGRIGRRLAAMATGIFARVQFHDPAVPADLDEVNAHSVGFEELLATSDVLSLQLAASAANAGMFDAELLGRMKRGAYLVNVSRGSLVDSHALAAAVATGHLAGAALDVLDTEPPAPDHPLLHRDRILVTPHVAYLSTSSEPAYVEAQARNAILWFSGKVVENSINGIRKRS